MKKISTFLLAIFLPLISIFYVAMPMVANAQQGNQGPFGQSGGIDVPSGKPITVAQVRDLAVDFLNFAFGFVGVAAAIVLLYGGYQLLIGSAKSDPKAYENAKNLVLGAIVALAIAFGAGIIVNTIYNLVTQDIGQKGIGSGIF